MSDEINSYELTNNTQAEIRNKNSVKMLRLEGIWFGFLAFTFSAGKVAHLIGIWSIPDSAGIGFIKTNSQYSWLMLVILPAVIGLGFWFKRRWGIIFFGVYFVIMVPGMFYHWLEGANLPNALFLLRATLDAKRSWQYLE